MTMAEVRVNNLTKIYDEIVAVNNVSFHSSDGGFFTILGPSGAGKTTTLEMIAGIKEPDEGEIYIGDLLVNDVSMQDRDVAMAFENYSLYPHLKVYDNIAFPLRSPARKEKLTREQEKEKVQEIADLLGIGEFLDRNPKQLSGGQKQRVSLARAMIRKPQVYLLDEPIAHLDAKLKVSARTTLKRLATKLGITIIYVTHDFKEALSLSDHIMILRDGCVEQIGTPDEVFNSPASDFVGRLVGDPPMNLIDGELIIKDNKTFFKAGDDFSIQLSEELESKAALVKRDEGGRVWVRIGVRPFNIKLAKEKISDNSFQLPVYAIEHEAESDIVAFELEEAFLMVKSEGRANMEISENAWLEFDQENIHFFNKTLELTKK